MKWKEQRMFFRYDMHNSKYPLKMFLLVKDQKVACQTINMSKEGAMIELEKPIDLLAINKESLKLILLFEGEEYLFDVTPQHHLEDMKKWGIHIKLTKLENSHNYFDIFMPIHIGQNLVKVREELIKQGEQEVYYSVFSSIDSTFLTIWHDSANHNKIRGFELVLDECCIRQDINHHKIEYFSHLSDKIHHNIHATVVLEDKLDPQSIIKVNKFFRCILANLSEDFPKEIKYYLEKCFFKD